MRESHKARFGSTRVIYDAGPGEVYFRWSDQWSAFDRGASSQEIPRIGAARCACAVKSFELLREAGVPTHFLEQVDERTIRVEEYAVPVHLSLSGSVHGRVVPLEWIWRSHVFGSLLRRLEEGTMSPEELGFAEGVEVHQGTPLPRVRLECTTKFEPVDRHLSNDEARNLAQLREEDWRRAWRMLEQAVGVMNRRFEEVGLLSPDGKLECAVYNSDGAFVVADVCGTPDENRILDARDGRVLSKDLIRDYLAEVGWKAELERTKAVCPGDKDAWPEYPELPQDLVDLVSLSYREVAQRYAGVRI